MDAYYTEDDWLGETEPHVVECAHSAAVEEPLLRLVRREPWQCSIVEAPEAPCRFRLPLATAPPLKAA